MIPACNLCPRNCGVLRGETGRGVCRSGEAARIARAALHFWEEPPISGTKGSGAVFFTGCTLGCVFCQNGEISHGPNRGKEVTPEELSEIFLSLVEQGAHNINLVTPTHFVPQIREALLLRKLPVPVVYNTSGYEKPETLKLLAGLVDIYLPDYKYDDPALAKALSRAEDYPQRAREGIREMVDQVGLPQYGEDGLLKRGVLIRHLILPGHTKNSIACLKRIKEEFPGVPVSLMAQYTPCGDLESFPELQRPITRREQQKVEDALFHLELEGFTQARTAKGKNYIPDFHSFEETQGGQGPQGGRHDSETV